MSSRFRRVLISMSAVIFLVQLVRLPADGATWRPGPLVFGSGSPQASTNLISSTNGFSVVAAGMAAIAETDNDMVSIPAGDFQMGCDANNPAEGGCAASWQVNEIPLHTVYLDAYEIDKHEVTNQRYQACVAGGVCSSPSSNSTPTRSSYYGNPAFGDYPVVYVSWEQANAFCNWEGKRLPTEAEWERASRGNIDTRRYAWGDQSPDCAQTNHASCVGDTTAVGSYPADASPDGVMDTAGNVHEWVSDWYDASYYTESPANNPQGPATGSVRGLRGGSWISGDMYSGVRTASRLSSGPYYNNYNVGFRCARPLGTTATPEPTATPTPVPQNGLSLLPNWSLGGAHPGAHYALVSMGDVNGDGYSDLVVGSSGYNGEGGAFLYYGSAGGLVTTHAWMVESNQASTEFGHSGIGDFNGDGYADIVIGAHVYDDVFVDEGAAFVYYGAPAGPNAMPDWRGTGGKAGAGYGLRVASAGDVNGDGYDELLVVARQHTDNFSNEGRAYLYYGSAAGLHSTPGWIVNGGQVNAYLSTATGVGDVNGDGYDDVFVGISDYDVNFTDEGRALLFFGSAQGIRTTPDWTLNGEQTGSYLGSSAGSAGDVNGDGYDDMIVGAYQYTISAGREGAAFVFHGGPTGPGVAANWTAATGQSSASVGAVNGIGDVNGDGYADVALGSPWYNGATGRAWVYHGAPAGLSSMANWTAQPDRSGSHYGWPLVGGDVNGDGYDDLAVGAHTYPDYQRFGRAYVYYGAGVSVPPSPTPPFDNTAPIIVPEIDGTLGSNGWYTSDVTVNWIVTDDESAITSQDGCDIQNVVSDTSDVTFTCTATSVGGSSSQSVTIRRDATIPNITLLERTAANSNGWNNGDVFVIWSCSDDTSGVVSASDSQNVSAEGGNQSATGDCTDQAGNIATATLSGIHIDKTSPIINVAAVSDPNTAGWYNSDVTVRFMCEDNLSGVASCPTDEVLTSEGVAVQSSAQTVSDLAGNSSEPSDVVTVQIDRTAPVVTVTGITYGASYPLGGVPIANCSSSDELSGIATEAVLTVSGGNPDGSGNFIAACTGATDHAGNIGNANVVYSVVYDWSNFFHPVDNLPTVNTANAGQAIPVNFSLGGDYGLNIFVTGSPVSRNVSCDNGDGDSSPVEETVNTGASGLRYDPVTQIYTYVWKTDKAWSGTCRQFIVRLIDGTEHVALFRFNGKARSNATDAGETASQQLFLPVVNH